MPVLFSMNHPLDEIAPVICRTSGIYAMPTAFYCLPEISVDIKTNSFAFSIIIFYAQQHIIVF